jgi:hypothetical protein
MATKSKTSPEGGKRGCLCKDGKYKKECCNGDLQNQGIGASASQSVSNVTNVDTTRVITRVSN